MSRCRRGVWGTEKIIGKLKDFIAKVKAYFDGLTTNTKAEAALLKEMRDGGLHYLERIVEAYDKAATAAVESYQGSETRSEGGETQYMARGRYWRPQLKRAEWALLERRMNAEIKSGENFLDEATKWVYADEKGVQVFALYGIGDGTDATPLYAVGGKKAAAYNAAMTEFMERKQKYDGDGRSVDPLPELLWRKEGSRSGNLSQTSRKAGDAEGVSELHGGSQRSDSGGAAERGTENQRGVKDQFSLREPVESYQGAETRSEGGENQYMARGRYWRPQLKRAERELLERRMNAEIKSGENLLDEATKWVYADEKGVQAFALYGIGDGTDATPLYAVGGKRATVLTGDMKEFINGGYYHDKGTGTALSRIRGFLRTQGDGGGDIRETSRGRSASADDALYGGERKGNSGRTSGRGTENQRGVKDQFSRREPVEETRDLLALHNMTAANLRGALKLVRQKKEFSKFGNGALQQLVSEVGVQELARINAQRQERLAVLDDVHSG